MGVFVNRPWVRVLSWSVASLIIMLNVFLLWETVTG
jgi:manganese transport protein